LKTATEVSPRAFQPFNLLGRAYLALDRYADAEVIYERAADLASAGDRRQLGGTFGFEGVGTVHEESTRKKTPLALIGVLYSWIRKNKGLEQKLSRARSR